MEKLIIAENLCLSLNHPEMIKPNDVLSIGTGGSLNPTDEFVFVAVKNGMHDSIGYSFTTSDSGEFQNLNGQYVKNCWVYTRPFWRGAVRQIRLNLTKDYILVTGGAGYIGRTLVRHYPKKGTFVTLDNLEQVGKMQ